MITSRPVRSESQLSQVSTDMNDAKWIPDQQIAFCMICDTEFSFLVRKHHCRECGYVACDPCSTKRLNVRGFEGLVRICDTCVETRGPATPNRTPLLSPAPTAVADSPNPATSSSSSSDQTSKQQITPLKLGSDAVSSVHTTPDRPNKHPGSSPIGKSPKKGIGVEKVCLLTLKIKEAEMRSRYEGYLSTKLQKEKEKAGDKSQAISEPLSYRHYLFFCK